MPVTPAQFKEEYSEFAESSDALVQAKLDEAYLRVGEPWGPFRDVGAKKLAAHLLWISPLTEPSDRTSPDDGSSDYLRDFERLQETARAGFFGTVADSGYGTVPGGIYGSTNPDRLTSVFGRVGDVLANFADYAASLIFNDSAVPGGNVRAALEWLQTSISNLAAGLLQLGNAVPVAVGTTGLAGDSPLASPLNHRHAHGDLPGGTLHGAADNTNAGFQSPAHFTKLEELPEAADLDAEFLALDESIADLNTVILSLVGGVADCAALTAFSLSSPVAVADGAHVWVDSVRDYFVLRTSALAVDGKSIVASSVAGRMWFRCEVNDPTWARQDLWYINPAAGNDEADGLTSGAALLTFAELIRRVGRRWTQRNHNPGTGLTGRVIEIYVIGGDLNEPVTLDILQDRGVTLYLRGTRTLRTSTTVNGAPTAQSGNTPGALTGTAWTPASEIGRLIRAASTDAYTWIAKDNGASNARVGPWLSVSQVSAIGATAGTPPSNGQTIETYTVTKMPTLNLRMGGGNAGRGIIMEDFEVDQYCAIAGTGGQHVFNRCKVNTATATRYWGGLVGFCNCYVGPNFGASLGNDGHCLVYLNGCVVMTTITPASSAKKSNLNVTNGTLFQACGITAATIELRFNNTLYGSAALFCDVTDPVQITGNGEVRCTAPIAGNNVTGYGVRLTGMSRLLVDSGVTNLITGTLGDFCFGRASGVPSTQNSAFAKDTATGLPTAAKRTLSWANLAATYAGAGFGGFVQDDFTGCSAAIN